MRQKWAFRLFRAEMRQKWAKWFHNITFLWHRLINNQEKPGSATWGSLVLYIYPWALAELWNLPAKNIAPWPQWKVPCTALHCTALRCTALQCRGLKVALILRYDFFIKRPPSFRFLMVSWIHIHQESQLWISGSGPTNHSKIPTFWALKSKKIIRKKICLK